jgi:hypothetical protein
MGDEAGGPIEKAREEDRTLPPMRLKGAGWF